MSRRDRRSVLTIGLLLAGVAVIFFLLTIAPPEPVRLLPRAGGIIYLDLRPLRAAGIFGKAGIQHDPDYQQFVDATGFELERDLNEAAFALSAIPTGAAPSPQHVAFSEVFAGRFNATKLAAYLDHLATQKERYRNHDVYEISFQGRMVRASILDTNIVAVSNAPGVQDIHTILDRRQQVLLSALPIGQDPLLLRYYHNVPLASVLWGILRLKSSPADDGLDLHMPGGYGVLFPPQTVLVASSRYIGTLQLRAEAFTRSTTDAAQIVNNVDTLLNLVRSIQASVHPAGVDRDVNAAFNSVRIEQDKTRAVLQATLPPGFVGKLFSDPAKQPQSVSSGNH